MFERKLHKKITLLANKFPVVAILGPRQSGKTTLSKMAFPNHIYVSLENLEAREYANSEPREFLESLMNSHGIIIDEAQYAPDLFSYIQVIVDEVQSPGQFILTGSQNFQLNRRISQSLAGRVAMVTLLPLSINELKKKNPIFAHYETLIFKGGYPRIHAQKIPPLDWYPNYIQTYVERDIRELKNVSDLSLFQRFVKLCAGRIGQLLNLSDLGRDCGISHNTARSWLSLLESSYILFLLQPYFRNFNKRIVKTPKLYFYDTGLACSLLGIESAKQIETHFLKGELFESLMISELMKQRLNHGLAPNLYFWRDKLGHEIDCLLEIGGKLLAIEVKSAKTIASDFFKNLEYWQNLSSGLKSEDCYLVYGGDQTQKRKYGKVIPWDKISTI